MKLVLDLDPIVQMLPGSKARVCISLEIELEVAGHAHGHEPHSHAAAVVQIVPGKAYDKPAATA